MPLFVDPISLASVVKRRKNNALGEMVQPQEQEGEVIARFAGEAPSETPPTEGALPVAPLASGAMRATIPGYTGPVLPQGWPDVFGGRSVDVVASQGLQAGLESNPLFEMVLKRAVAEADLARQEWLRDKMLQQQALEEQIKQYQPSEEAARMGQLMRAYADMIRANPLLFMENQPQPPVAAPQQKQAPVDYSAWLNEHPYLGRLLAFSREVVPTGGSMATGAWLSRFGGHPLSKAALFGAGALGGRAIIDPFVEMIAPRATAAAETYPGWALAGDIAGALSSLLPSAGGPAGRAGQTIGRLIKGGKAPVRPTVQNLAATAGGSPQLETIGTEAPFTGTGSFSASSGQVPSVQIPLPEGRMWTQVPTGEGTFGTFLNQSQIVPKGGGTFGTFLNQPPNPPLGVPKGAGTFGTFLEQPPAVEESEPASTYLNPPLPILASAELRSLVEEGAVGVKPHGPGKVAIYPRKGVTVKNLVELAKSVPGSESISGGIVVPEQTVGTTLSKMVVKQPELRAKDNRTAKQKIKGVQP